jgi:hypothetical protein
MITDTMDVPEFERIVRVYGGEGCLNCERQDDGGWVCTDGVSLDQITFPAYKNETSGVCYNESTVRDWIQSRHATGGVVTDPHSRKRWVLPIELVPSPPASMEENLFDYEPSVVMTAVIDLIEAGRGSAGIRLFRNTIQNCGGVDGCFSPCYVLKLLTRGYNQEARELFDVSIELAHNFEDFFAPELYQAGMTSRASELVARTLQFAHTYRASRIARMYNIGMVAEAKLAYAGTIGLAKKFSVEDVLALCCVGMMDEARDSFQETLQFTARKFVPTDVILLRRAGLTRQARALLRKTIPFAFTRQAHGPVS